MNQADKFSEARRKLGFTQGYVAEKANLEQWQVSNIENGKKKIPYKQLIDFYVKNGISKEWLMEKEEPISEWKDRALKAEKEVANLKDTISELRQKMNFLYEHYITKEMKIEGLEMGKRKASSTQKTTLSKKFVYSN